MIGALDENLLTNKYFIASHSYYHDELTWCVQKKQPIPLWKNVFYVCRDPIVFVMHTVSCFLLILTFYFIQQFEDMYPKWDWHRITLSGFCICCGFPCEAKPKIASHRIQFLFCLFAFMIFNISCLTIGIRSNTIPIYEHQIDSILHIVSNSFELVGDDFALEHLMRQNEVDYNINIGFFLDGNYFSAFLFYRVTHKMYSINSIFVMILIIV